MASSFVAKKLIAATRSSLIRHHATAVATNPQRGFFSKTSIPDPYTDFINRIGMWVVKFTPHTVSRMSRVTSEGRLEEAITRRWENDPPRFVIPKGLKLCVNIPGIEKVTETDESLCVFIDLGLNEPDMKDFEDHQVEVKLKKLEALFIEGYVQKQRIRKNFYARVNFTPIQRTKVTNMKPFKTEIKDGGLMVTIPKKQNLM